MNIQNILTAPLRWYGELPKYLTSPGWREDDSDKPLAERSNRVVITYSLRQNQQRNNREVLLAKASGLVPGDAKAGTLETQVLGFLKDRFSERQIEQGTERVLRGAQTRKELELTILYPPQEEALIVASYGDYGNVQMVQKIVDRFSQLEESGAIDLFQE